MSPVNINDELYLLWNINFIMLPTGPLLDFSLWFELVQSQTSFQITIAQSSASAFHDAPSIWPTVSNPRMWNVQLKEIFEGFFPSYKQSKYLITFFFLTVHWRWFQQHTYNNRQYNLPSNNPLFWHFVTVAAIHGPIKVLEAFQIFSV